MLKRNGFLRLDAADSAFFFRELDHVEQKMFAVKYPELMYAILIPTRTNFDPGALKYIFRMLDEVGEAALITDKSQLLPRVDVKGEEYSGPVRLIGDSYGYSHMEILGARKAGTPLDQMRANAARRVMFRKLETTALFGHEVAKVKGLFNHSAVTVSTAPGGDWPTKTTEEVIADLNAPFEAIDSATKGVEVPNTVVLPSTRYRYVSMTPYSPNSDKTILQWWLAANEGVTVHKSPRLETAGAGGTKRMVVYRRDPETLELLNPLGFYQFEPRRVGAEYLIECIMTTAGVILRYPKAVHYQDGI